MMDNETPIPTPEESPERPPYPRGRFVALIIALVALVILMGVAERQSPGPKDDGGGFSEALLQVDLAVKIHCVYEQWMPLIARTDAAEKKLNADLARIMTTAVSTLMSEVDENPSANAIRKLIIVGGAVERRSAITKLERLLKLRMKTGDEVQMWRAIYLSKAPLTSAQAAGYSSVIGHLDLGWYRYFALADLYDKAHLKKQADEERSLAGQAALRTVVSFLAVIAVVFILGLVGIGVLIAFVNARVTGRLVAREAQESLSPSERSWVSGYLLETFVAYLVIVIGTQILAAPLLGESPSPGTAVWVTVSVYVTSGIMSALYLRFRIRSAGWPWTLIGLGSTRKWLDIGWGIAGYAAALPLVLPAALLSRFLDKIVPTPSNPVVPLFVESSGLAERLTLLALVSLAAPFFEEIFFRGVLYHSFRASWGVALGIAASAVVFGLLHPLPLNFLPIAVLGSVFGVLTYQRGSLLPSMVAHAINNTVSFLIITILVSS